VRSIKFLNLESFTTDRWSNWPMNLLFVVLWLFTDWRELVDDANVIPNGFSVTGEQDWLRVWNSTYKMASNSSNESQTIIGEITKDKEYQLQEHPLKKPEAISAVSWIIYRLFTCQSFEKKLSKFLSVFSSLAWLKSIQSIRIWSQRLLYQINKILNNRVSLYR